ncbi:MAG: hypothetical protein ACE3JQ_08260 [Paenisporosarcina sp.]
MEIIILAIIGFIFNLLTKSKNTENKSKPFMQKPLNQQQPKKRMEDFAKEIYQDVQKQISTKQLNSRGKDIDPMSRKKLEGNIKTEISKAEQPLKRAGRLSVHNPVSSMAIKKPSAPSLIPKTGNELIQAIVFSEILAPPKSKR